MAYAFYQSLPLRREAGPEWMTGKPQTIMREARENDMRLKTFASIVMFVSFAFGFGAHAQQSDISSAPSPALTRRAS
jgi:hypothetical protein